MTRPNPYEIWPVYEVFYITSMLFNAESALASAQWLSKLFAEIEAGERDINPHYPLNELQNIVLNGAALSRYFWPVRAGHEQRAAKLRSAFKVAEGNPLQNRDLRNHMEHFDERLDDYLAAGVVGQIFPSYFGPTPPPSQVRQHFFRAYYTDSGVFEILGKPFEIMPIVDEIVRIHELLTDFEKNGSRLPQEEKKGNAEAGHRD